MSIITPPAAPRLAASSGPAAGAPSFDPAQTLAFLRELSAPTAGQESTPTTREVN